MGQLICAYLIKMSIYLFMSYNLRASKLRSGILRSHQVLINFTSLNINSCLVVSLVKVNIVSFQHDSTCRQEPTLCPLWQKTHYFQKIIPVEFCWFLQLQPLAAFDIFSHNLSTFTLCIPLIIYWEHELYHSVILCVERERAFILRNRGCCE